MGERRMGRVLAVLLTAGVVIVAATGPASAHNVLTGSSPSDGARLRTAPAQVTLTFNQPVRHGYDTIAVTGPGGGRYDAGRTTVADRTVRVRMRPPGPAGAYEIGYRILSADGHPVTGRLRFTLTTAGPGKPAPALGTTTRGGGTWMWIAGGTVLVLLGVVVLLRRARRVRP